MISGQEERHSLLEAAEEALYLQWKRHGKHFEEYASEFVGTAFHIFAVVAVVAIVFAKSSPVGHWIPPLHLRLFIAGLLIGGSGSLVAISPAGRLSGGHINPAMSLGFWALGRMHSRDLIGYVIGQMAGGVCGALAAAAVLPKWTQEVKAALLAPAAGLTPLATFGLEVAATFFLATVIFSFVASKRLMRYTPLAVPITAGFLVFADGALSGAGLNPARWFGPAAMLSTWSLGWVYVIGPAAGAILAAAIRRHPSLPGRPPHTCKLFHDNRFRSVFKHDEVPSTPPAVVTKAVGS